MVLMLHPVQDGEPVTLFTEIFLPGQKKFFLFPCLLCKSRGLVPGKERLSLLECWAVDGYLFISVSSLAKCFTPGLFGLIGTSLSPLHHWPWREEYKTARPQQAKI